MANKYIWCVEIYVFDVQLGYTNVMSLSQAYRCVLCELHVQPIITAEVAFFHLHFFH